MKISTISLLLLLTVALGCKQKKTTTATSVDTNTENQIEYVNSMRVKTPRRADLFTYGTPIQILVTNKKRFGDVDSIQLLGDGKLIATRTSKPWKWQWTPTQKTMGKHSIKLLAYHQNGKRGIINTYINIKSNQVPKQYKYKVAASFPHDPNAYTQGLFFHKGFLYEGTGQYGESSLRKVNPKNGKILYVNALDQKYFGEGITLYNNKIIQLTWREQKAFVFNANTFEQEDSFQPVTSNGEGWGITTIGDDLVISDGSNVLSFIDANDYHLKRTVQVYDNKGAVLSLNELEYINGKIYANVWLTDKIVIINPKSGEVEAVLNLKGILKPRFRSRINPSDDVLNGIAWDKTTNKIFVTGKRWPRLFEIEVQP